MKKIIAMILVLILVLGFSGIAVLGAAEPPTVTIISDNGLYTVEQGGTLNLTATSVMGTNQHNWRLTAQEWTGATRTGGNVVGDEVYASTPPSGDLTFVSNAVFSAEGKEIGVYEVRYSISVLRLNGNQAASGNDDVSVEVIEVSIPVYVEPMAAPAIAARILKFNGVQPRYGKGKNGGNFIADVAPAMGPKTTFNGIDKEIWNEDAGRYVSNPAYWDEVLAFLNAHPEKPKAFESAYNWFAENLD